MGIGDVSETKKGVNEDKLSGVSIGGEGERHADDTAGAANDQRTGGSVKRGSACGDVIDQTNHGTRVERRSARERTAHVGDAIGSAKSNLWWRHSRSLKRIDDRAVDPRRQPVGNQPSLVEPTLAMPEGVEWHRHEEVEAAISMSNRVSHLLGTDIGQVTPATVLGRAHSRLRHTLIANGSDRGELRRPVTTSPAHRYPTRRDQPTAIATRTRDSLKLRKTRVTHPGMGCDQAVVTMNAARWQQQVRREPDNLR